MTENIRKLLGLLVCLIVVVMKPVLGGDISETEGWLMGALYAAFVSGNIGEHLSNALKQRAAAVISTLGQEAGNESTSNADSAE